MPGQTLEQTQACLQSCRQVKDITSKDVIGIDNLYWGHRLKSFKVDHHCRDYSQSLVGK